MKQKFKYIFSLKLAGYLMYNNQRILRINHNLNIPGKDVYVFENTSEVCKLMSEYTNKFKGEQNGNTNKRSKIKT